MVKQLNSNNALDISEKFAKSKTASRTTSKRAIKVVNKVKCTLKNLITPIALGDKTGPHQGRERKSCSNRG
jgi:hypothetical protein